MKIHFRFVIERLGSRYRFAASHHTTAIHVSVEVFLDAAVPHKSAEGRYKNYEWSQLIVVEKREAVKRECTEAKRRVDSAKPNPQGAQASAREHQPSEFFQNRAEGRKGSAAQSKIGEPPSGCRLAESGGI